MAVPAAVSKTITRHLNHFVANAGAGTIMQMLRQCSDPPMIDVCKAITVREASCVDFIRQLQYEALVANQCSAAGLTLTRAVTVYLFSRRYRIQPWTELILAAGPAEMCLPSQ